MSETKKLTQEEIDKLRNLQSLYSELTIKLGQTQIEKILIQKQLDRIHTLSQSYEQEYSDLVEKENNILKDLESKYGAITVNLDTGEIS